MDRTKFKNKNSSYFKDGKRWVPFYRELLDDDNKPLEVVREYLYVARPILHPDCDALFVTTAGKRMGDSAFDAIASSLSRAHLVALRQRGQEIKDAKPFSNHAFRDFLATAVLKLTNSRERAADAIADTVSSVDRYLRWLPSNRYKDLIAAISTAVRRPRACVRDRTAASAADRPQAPPETGAGEANGFGRMLPARRRSTAR